MKYMKWLVFLFCCIALINIFWLNIVLLRVEAIAIILFGLFILYDDFKTFKL